MILAIMALLGRMLNKYEIQGSKLLQNVKKKTIDEKRGPGKMTLQSANL